MMKNMCMGFLNLLVLSIILLESGVLAPNSWRATGAEVRCIEKEREALLQFKAALGNNSSIYPWSSWHDRDCCEWEGVICNNQTGHVLMLQLPGPGDWTQASLPGKINESLMELQYLMYFNLSFNHFQDANIPEFFGFLNNLRHLDLKSCHLSGGNIPSQLGLLSHLQYLDLSYNTLEGAIPYQLANLSQLQHLDFSYNFLKGEIPYQLGNLSQLQHLDLSNNNGLEGAIPYQLGNLSQLQHLDLSDSGLEGVIPYQLGNLSQLRHLDLSNNGLEGAIPYQLGNLLNLQKLFLSYAGTLKIDEENGTRGEWLSSLTSLTHLTLVNITDLKYSHNWLQIIARLSNLKELMLPQNDLSDQNIPSLPSSKFNSSSSLSECDLSSNNFMSPAIFHWLSNFSSNVVELDLSRNLLKGPIPYEFGGIMNSLENLYLGDNKLEGGLKSLGNICTLHSLPLYNNCISEDLQTLSGCAKYSLQFLDLSNNQITGTLVDLSTFTSLKAFSISSNLLNGSIPKDIRFPTSLVTLDISNNSLTGILIDSYFTNMPNLKTLDLSDNSLALRFSHNWVPPFQLEAIYLRSCKLGPSFPKWLQTQNSFTELDISNVGISDTIPKQFWGLLTSKLINLNVSCNSFSGSIPNVPTKFTESPTISLASNHFKGPVPQFLRNAWSLFLSDNNFSELRLFLCDGATYMGILDLSNNQLFGQLPDCWENFKSLVFLDLSNNNLSGEFPTSIGSVQSLQTFILRNNGFAGELPIALRSCSNLMLLDAGENKFSGHMPSWIGVGLQQLEILILRNNNFSGSLSTHLCYLSNLHFLDLSLNNLSGQILECFKNFTPMALENPTYLQGVHYALGSRIPRDLSYELSALLTWKGTERLFEKNLFLKGIDLSSNQLNGGIPTELGILVGMVSLNLSRNQLNGKIPIEIGGLTSLDLLDLSRNHFIGPIPSSLTMIDRLAMLDLSYNNLSGKIPIGTQLQSFSSSSYEGNLDLCEKPLEKKCPQENKTDDPAEFQQDRHSILSKEFYWSMIFGFIIGFWGIFGPILFSRSWRHAYFKFLNNLTDTIIVLITINKTKCITWLKGYPENHG